MGAMETSEYRCPSLNVKNYAPNYAKEEHHTKQHEIAFNNQQQYHLPPLTVLSYLIRRPLVVSLAIEHNAKTKRLAHREKCTGLGADSVVVGFEIPELCTGSVVARRFLNAASGTARNVV